MTFPDGTARLEPVSCLDLCALGAESPFSTRVRREALVGRFFIGIVIVSVGILLAIYLHVVYL